jgi:hypothetical protein
VFSVQDALANSVLATITILTYLHLARAPTFIIHGPLIFNFLFSLPAT